jgi:CDP-glucose 4,6-dehydratase
MPFSGIESQRITDRPILLTGHTGFKGAWFQRLLQALGYEVAGFSLEPKPGSLYSELQPNNAMHEQFGDIRNHSELKSFVAAIRPEIIFHFAAQAIVLDSYTDPLGTFSTNVLGTANLLESAFACDSVKAVAVVTTDKVYENQESGRKFLETDSLMGKDPYSASKVGTEQVVAAWRQIEKVSGGPKVISLRAGNVIGGGDIHPTRLMPQLIHSFTTGNKLLIRNPQATRPWQHVLDPLHGYLKAVQHQLAGNDVSALNFSCDSNSLTVSEVVTSACKKWGARVDDVVEFNDQPNNKIEARTLDLDSTKSRKILHWKSNWTQEEAVESTISWWKNFKVLGHSPAELCDFEINYSLGQIK